MTKFVQITGMFLQLVQAFHSRAPGKKKYAGARPVLVPHTNYRSQLIKDSISFSVLWPENDMLCLLFYIITIYQCY